MKKLRNARPFLCGMLTAVLLMGLIGSAMAANLVTKELYYNDIKVRLNGKTLNPTDANGNKVEPFVIDGTTYLPIRAVGEALGLNVSWDGATSTVILGNDPEFKQPAAWLGEMETFTGSATEKKIERDGQYNYSLTANNGDTFDRYYYPNAATGTTYLLKGQYKTFTGILYMPEYQKTTGTPSRFQILLDDKLVYTSPEVGAGIEPVEFSINLSGAYKMEIVTQGNSNGAWVNCEYSSDSSFLHYGYYHAHIANAALWTD